MAQEKGGVGTFGNIITIIVFVIIITIGLWGAISAVRLAPRIFGSISETITGNRPIAVTLPSAEVKSGEPFTLTWEDRSREDGLYTVVYDCTPNFEMSTATNGSPASLLPCSMPFAVPTTETSIRLVPILKSGELVSVPLTISYVAADGTHKTEGRTSLTVLKGARTVAAATTTPTTGGTAPAPQTTPTTPAPQQPAGKPDLVIRSISMGIIDPMTGAFIPKNVFGSYETVSYKFDVANRGAGRSGQWSFSANLPTRGTPTPYHSPVQNPLDMGDHIEFTLNFSGPASGSISIQVDPSNTVAESSESNNILNEYISVVY